MKRPLDIAVWLPRLAIALFAIALVFLLPLGFGVMREGTQTQMCQHQLKSIGEFLRLYARDYDGKFPPAKIRSHPVAYISLGTPNYVPVGWADAICFYSHSSGMLACPWERNPQVSDASKKYYSDFWMNGLASGARASQAKSPESTILAGDGSDGLDLSNAAYSKTSLPPAWILDQQSPAYRHRGAANYLMIDGSVQWIKPEDVTHFGGRGDAFVLR